MPHAELLKLQYIIINFVRGFVMEDMKDILRKWKCVKIQLEEAYKREDGEQVIKAAKQMNVLAGEILRLQAEIF